MRSSGRGPARRVPPAVSQRPRTAGSVPTGRPRGLRRCALARLRPAPPEGTSGPSRRDPARWRRHPRERPRPRGGRHGSAPSRPAPPGLIDDSEPLRKGRARCKCCAAPFLQSKARSLGTRRVSPFFFHVLTHFCSKKNVFSGADRTPTAAPGHIPAGNYRQNPRGTAPPPHTPTRTQSAPRAGAALPAAGAPGEGHRGGGRRRAPGGGLRDAAVPHAWGVRLPVPDGRFLPAFVLPGTAAGRGGVPSAVPRTAPFRPPCAPPPRHGAAARRLRTAGAPDLAGGGVSKSPLFDGISVYRVYSLISTCFLLLLPRLLGTSLRGGGAPGRSPAAGRGGGRGLPRPPPPAAAARMARRPRHR